MAFGQVSYGNAGNTFWKNWKLRTPDPSKGEVKTSFVCVIIPPIKSLEESGKWAVYHGQHFGYSGTDPRDPNKSKQRPFACIEKSDFRTKMVTVACPACEAIREKEAEFDRRETEYKAQGLSESEVRERLDPLTQWLKKHNVDRKWHINVMNEAGEFGVLQVSHSVYKMLKAKIEELQNAKRPIADPIGAGVWFNFTRMGKFPVQDAVEVVMVENEDGSETKKVTGFTEAQEAQAKEICPDIARDTVKFITASQIAAIVASSGDPEEIDRIWQMGTPTTTPRRERSPAPAPSRNVAAQSVPSNPDPGSSFDEEEALKARLAALQAQKAKAAEPVKTQVAPAAAAVPMNASEDLSDEEFMARFAPKQ